jgi:hypothetical protein
MATLCKIQGILLVGDAIAVDHTSGNSQSIFVVLIKYLAGIVVLFGMGYLIGSLFKHDKHKF